MRSIYIIVLILNVLIVKAESKYSFGGRLFLDGGVFLNSPKSFNSGVCIPDLRFTGKAYFSDGWYTKLDVGFASNKVKLKDAFLQKTKDRNTFRLGYMIGMFSLDQSSSTNDYLFMTGSNVAETFYPDRRIGISYTFSESKLYFSGGAFCGDGLNFNNNIRQGFNFTARFVYRPINNNNCLLHIGVGGLYKRPDKNIDTGETSISFKNSGITYLHVPYVFDSEITNVKDQLQWGFESILHYHRMFLQGEIMGMAVRKHHLPDYYALGTYLEGGFFILGRKLGYDQLDALPTCPDKDGSLAVFSRISYTDLNDFAIKYGSLFDISLGINYYINNNIIVKLNYSNVRTDKFSAIGKSEYSLIQSRIQIRF